jgi:hypothetical protein
LDVLLDVFEMASYGVLACSPQLAAHQSQAPMTNASGGYRFRARGMFVGDAATETVRVDKFKLTCLGP